MSVFEFFKKKAPLLPLEEAPQLEVDLHSHIIPSIDDGCQNMEESISLLKGLEALGYKKVITTPHIMYDAYHNTKASILDGLKVLQDEVSRRGIAIEIEAAAEYYLDEGFMALLHQRELILIAGKYLLFETSYTHRPIQLEEVIFEIMAAGYVPLLAHPERYRYIKDPAVEYGELKALGTQFQVNLNSLGGLYGKQAKAQADFLSQAGMIDFLGSDAHHIKHVENLSEVFKSVAYQEIYRYNTIRNNTL